MQKKQPDNSAPPPAGKTEGKKDKWFLPLLALFIIALYLLQPDEPPPAGEHGVFEWAAECGDARRRYRLFSGNVRNSTTLARSPTGRYLSFLDAAGDALYQTRAFDADALETDGVWKFSYQSRDRRLLVKKDQAAVLRGDEEIFRVDKNFGWMKITTKDGGEITLNCRALKT